MSLPRQIVVFSSCLTISLAANAPVFANIQKATIQEILDGDELFIDDQKARVEISLREMGESAEPTHLH